MTAIELNTQIIQLTLNITQERNQDKSKEWVDSVKQVLYIVYQGH